MASLTDALIHSSADNWQAYTQHEFVVQLAKGSLPQESFVHYLKQDYVFLIHFARTFGLAAFKSKTIDDLRHAKASLVGILDVELDLHIAYCKQWNLDEAALINTTESTANMAYTRYVMERGLSGDLLDLNVALAPCILGYRAVAQWLMQQPFLQREDNPYFSWIEMYASNEYAEVAQNHKDAIDRIDASSLPAPRMQELSDTFDAATRLEIGFWEMALHQL